MSKRRSSGDGGIHWEEDRQRWCATLTIGYTPAGKRITRKRRSKTKTGAKDALKELKADFDAGLTAAAANYKVADAVKNWLQYGLTGRDPGTVETKRMIADTHVIPQLGARKLHELSADEVDEWLADRARLVSTRTLQEIKSILRRSIHRAQARDKVRRNVVLLCETPDGRPGRPSKSLTLVQAKALLVAALAEETWLKAYVVLSLLVGGRTEELRPLTWSHVHLDGGGADGTQLPAHIWVWRSVRKKGDTKTEKSRRSLALPELCVSVLRHQEALVADLSEHPQRRGVKRYAVNDLVFPSDVGTLRNAGNVRRSFRRVVKAAGLIPEEWTPRELRHSFVSVLSDSGMSIEQISRLVGHSSTSVTEKVYRHQLRPVIQDGAVAMDGIFSGEVA